MYTHTCIFLLFVIPFRKVHSYLKSFLVPCFPTLHCDLSVMMLPIADCSQKFDHQD